MQPPHRLNYQSPLPPQKPPRRAAVFLPLGWIALSLGSISVLGFIAFPAWPAGWSAILSIVALLLAIFSRTAVSTDRTVRSYSIWMAGCGAMIFGVITLIHLVLTKC
jgi:hypothetical protein